MMGAGPLNDGGFDLTKPELGCFPLQATAGDQDTASRVAGRN
jgi:hypothetical protein